ncbi:hypothetical protein MMC14_006650 [Varicellaria rhodocarpa]|nr:hypothetical protein [Varicellaria rhodocarpa]
MPIASLVDIAINHNIPDPLPLYSRRDPEAISIRSSAPSYVSEAPTYISTVPPSPPPLERTQTASIPTPTFAPGFRPIFPSSVSDISNHRFNINEWSSVRSGHQSRHYQKVADRRATQATMEDHARVQSLARGLSTPTAPITGKTDSYFPMTTSFSAEAEIHSATRFPLEDPDLVGPLAAKQARDRRLYLEKHANEQAAMNQESKTWDFMLSQMADWGERERSWEGFRRDVERRGGFLGKAGRRVKVL